MKLSNLIEGCKTMIAFYGDIDVTFSVTEKHGDNLKLQYFNTVDFIVSDENEESCFLRLGSNLGDEDFED